MPSAAFTAAAKAGNREPILLMAIESVDAVRREVASQSDWQASKSLTTIDTTTTPGEVTIGETTVTLNPTAGTVAPYGTRVKSVTGNLKFTYTSGVDAAPASCDWYVYCYLKDQSGTVKDTGTIFFSFSDWFQYDYVLSVPGAKFIFHNEPLFAEGDRIEIDSIAYSASYTDFNEFNMWDLEWDTTSVPMIINAETGNLTTKTLDIGQKFGSDSVLQIDDVVPSGGSVVITARGSDNGSTWVDLGTVTDGRSVDPYRYYDFHAVLTAGFGALPRLKEIAVIGGDSQFEYFGTHRDQPVAGVKPLLAEKGLSAVSSRVELLKPATTGDVSVKMVWSKETSDLLATGYLRGKLVYLSHGFNGLSSNEFEPLGTYTWHDYTADPTKMIINVKLRDVFKQFEKVKVPQETWPAADGTRSIVALTWTDINIIQAMLDIFDAVGIPDRLLDRAAFTALRDGAYSSATWLVSRTITDPTEAADLLNELRVTAGLFLVPQRNGKLAPVVYDPTATEVANLDAEVVKFGTIDGGQKELFTEQVIYYSPKAGETDPSGAKDYDKVLIDLDAQAESDWNLVATQQWFDKWNCTLAALTSLGSQLNGLFATPMLRLSVTEIPMALIGVQGGQIVTVDNLLLPDVAANWPNRSVGRKFLVLRNAYNPSTYSISMDLYDTGETGAAGPGAIGTTIDLSGPSQVWGAASIFVATGGDGSYTFTTTLGTITDLGNGFASLDIAGLSGVGTVTVKDATGKATKRVKVTPPQVVAGTLTGNLTNAVFEGVGAVSPVDLSATIANHFDSNGWPTAQAQVDAGFEIYVQPTSGVSVYEEVFDLGELLPEGTTATAVVNHIVLAGALHMAPTVTVSVDGTTWTTPDGVWSVDVSGARYIKMNIAISGTDNSALAQITGIRLNLEN